MQYSMATSFDTADQLRAMLFAMLESMPGGVLLADPRGMLIAANQKAGNILGLVGSAIQNRNCWEVLERVLGADQHDLAGLRFSGGSVLLAPRAGVADEPSYLLVSRNDLQSPFRSVGGFFLSIEDVTYPVMVEAQRHRRQRFDAMQDMAISVSQELKNPLGSLELLTSLLERELAADPDYQRITGQMRNAVRTMNHLLDNYLTFARLPGPEWRNISIGKVLAAVLDTLRPLGLEREVVFDCHAGHQPDDFTADAALLGQLLLNLGINAMESMPDGGVVQFATRTLPPNRHHPPLLEIRCRDSGSGIVAATQEKIFDPFFSTKGGSRGLGLAIVHHIAESHGGFVRAESTAQGSTFTVLLPYNK